MAAPIKVNDRVRINDYTKAPKEDLPKIVGVVFRVTRVSEYLPIVEITNDTTGDKFAVGRGLVTIVEEAPEDDDSPMTAADFLRAAGETLIDRGKSRDNGQERSMARTVRAFNAMTGHELTEEEGWLFMRYLKDSRARSGDYNRDDFLDGVGYAVLQAECADREANA